MVRFKDRLNGFYNTVYNFPDSAKGLSNESAQPKDIDKHQGVASEKTFHQLMPVCFRMLNTIENDAAQKARCPATAIDAKAPPVFSAPYRAKAYNQYTAIQSRAKGRGIMMREQDLRDNPAALRTSDNSGVVVYDMGLSPDDDGLPNSASLNRVSGLVGDLGKDLQGMTIAAHIYRQKHDMLVQLTAGGNEKLNANTPFNTLCKIQHP